MEAWEKDGEELRGVITGRIWGAIKGTIFTNAKDNELKTVLCSCLIQLVGEYYVMTILEVERNFIGYLLGVFITMGRILTYVSEITRNLSPRFFDQNTRAWIAATTMTLFHLI